MKNKTMTFRQFINEEKTEFKTEKEFMKYVYGNDYNEKDNWVDRRKLSNRSKKMTKEFGTTWDEYKMMLNNRKMKVTMNEEETKNDENQLYWYAFMTDEPANCSSHYKVERYYKEHPFVIFVQTTEEIGEEANDYFADYTIFNSENYDSSNESEHKAPQEMLNHYEENDCYVLFEEYGITDKDDMHDVLNKFYDIVYNKDGIGSELEKKYFEKFGFGE